MNKLKFYIQYKIGSKISHWIYLAKIHIRLKIKHFGRKNVPMSEEFKIFHHLILKTKFEFQKKHKGILPDVTILRNKAATLYRKYKESERNNRSYLEKFMDVEAKSIIDTTGLIIALKEPCLYKPEIEMIRYGTSLKRVFSEIEEDDEMQTVTLELINGCEEDLVVKETL